MNNAIYFKDMFESIPDYRKIVLIFFLIQNDKKLLLKIGFSERNINRLILEFKNILTEEFEEILDYVRNEEESKIERFLDK